MRTDTVAKPTPEEQSAADEQTAAMEAYVPEGFETKDDYLAFVRYTFDQDASYDLWNREAAIDDLKFVGMDQWDPVVRQSREAQGRPCLSINVLPQFIGQVVGDRRINKTQIKVVPTKDATVDMANARSGLIKSIENYSRAERIYDMACEDQVTCGISAWRVALEYADDDVFEQDIRLKFIPNPLGVVWDFMSIDPTGRDARHCWVNDTIPRRDYDARFPNNPAPSQLGDGMTEQYYWQWFTTDTVQITEHWRIIERDRTLALLTNGKTLDVTDMDPSEYMQEVQLNPRTQQPYIRDARRKYAQMHLVTGNDILEGPYELPITRLPIIKVEGRVVRVAEDRVRYGLVRFAKDSQRLKNYWRSTSAEMIALAPKAVWIAPSDAIQGREADFRNANNDGDSLLIYNKNASLPPQRVDPPPVATAVLNEANMCQQDIKDTTGLHDASLGVKSNEVSGKAILARQREGDVATVIYHDNLNSSIQESGDVVNQLLGYCYDTVRVLRTIGDDDKAKLIAFNDFANPDSVDLSVGKYDVEIVTGPSYTTQRIESAEAMMETLQVAPQLMGIAGDLIIAAQDWPKSVEIAERVKKSLPPQLTEEEGAQPDPQQQAQQQAAMALAAQQLQQQQQMQQIEMAKQQAELEKAQEEVKIAQANARKADAEADEAEIKAGHSGLAPFVDAIDRDRAHDLRAQSAASKNMQNGSRPPVRQAKKGNKK